MYNKKKVMDYRLSSVEESRTLEIVDSLPLFMQTQFCNNHNRQIDSLPSEYRLWSLQDVGDLAYLAFYGKSETACELLQDYESWKRENRVREDIERHAIVFISLFVCSRYNGP